MEGSGTRDAGTTGSTGRAEAVDVAALHRRAVQEWVDRVRAVGDEQWDQATPCAAYTVRDLVAHVVGEDLWTVPLMHGRTIAQVGDSLSGDPLGAEPLTSAVAAATDAIVAVAETLPDHPTVHLSFGDAPADEYVWQLLADHLVHGWDLAAATGQDRRLDHELVTAVAGWFAQWEDTYRASGVVGPRVEITSDHSQDRLLAAFGREPDWQPADG